MLERLLARGYGAPIELGWRATQLRYVAQALNKGDIALACISLVRMELPPLPTGDHARAMAMAKADGLLVKYNPDWEDEPRVPAGDPAGGQWTSEGQDGAGGGDAAIQPAADRADETQARKERFVDAHLADAQSRPARRAGLSAVESKWGESRFAVQGNNYFGIHYPAPFATGYMVAEKSGVKVATFASYADSLRSFVAISGGDVQGVGNPSAFAAALHDSGKFGVGNPNYTDEVSRTIKRLRATVSRRKA